jgi:uncharacterized protein YaaQ
MMDQLSPDRLAILTVTGSQVEMLMKQLAIADFHFTVINTTGQLMQEPVTCLLIGFPQSRQSSLLELVREYCKTYRQFIPTQNILPGELASLPMIEAQLGGALVCILAVERYEQL